MLSEPVSSHPSRLRRVQSLVMPEITETVDLAIIGAGPVGLYGAYYAGMRQMSVKLIDSLSVLGGQLVTLYPEKYIYDVAGYPKVLAKVLAANLIEQAMQYNPQVCLDEAASELTRDDAGVWTITTNRAAHRARTVLIAAGLGAFQPKRLNLPEAPAFEGNGLFYAATTIAPFTRQRVLIVGGGDSAVDWANMLAPVASSLTLIHRRDAFRAHEASVQQMLAGPTKVHTFHELRRLEGDGKIERAVIYDNRSNAEQVLDVDAVLVNVGFNSSLGPIQKWGLTIEQNAIRVDHGMMSSLSGVFSAGDVATYPGKLKLISVGFGEAAIAVNHAKQFIDPKARLFPGHSSEMKR